MILLSDNSKAKGRGMMISKISTSPLKNLRKLPASSASALEPSCDYFYFFSLGSCSHSLQVKSNQNGEKLFFHHKKMLMILRPTEENVGIMKRSLSLEAWPRFLLHDNSVR